MSEPSSPVAMTRSKPWGIWATLFFSALVFGVFLITQTLVFLVTAGFKTAQEPGMNPEIVMERLSLNGFTIAIATLIASPICIALLLLVAKLRRYQSAYDYLGLRRPSKKQIVEWCLVAVMCNVVIDLLKSFVDLPIVPEFVLNIYQTAYFLPAFYLALILIAPLFEEIFFRGFMFQGFKYSAFGVPGAIMLPALFWALIHTQYDWFDKLGIFVLGLALGVARLRTRSTYVTISMHSLSNFLALLQVTWHNHFS